MKKIFNICYLSILSIFTIFVLLNTFVLSEVYQVANNSSKNKT